VLDVVTAELKHRFQQERSMPIAALLEKILLDAAKGSFSVYPNELQIYDNDVKIDYLISYHSAENASRSCTHLQ